MIDATAPGHRCRRGAGCPGRGIDDTGRVGALIDLPGLCDADQALLECALPELPLLWLALRAMIVPGSTGAVPARCSRTPPLPLRVDPLVTADAIHDELTRWEEILRDRMGMGAPTRGHTVGAQVKRAAYLLSRAVPSLLALGPTPHMRWDPDGIELQVHEYVDGYDAAVILLELHRRASRVAGHTVLVHYLPAPCPLCEAQTLRRVDGEDYVYCASCGTTSTTALERARRTARISRDALHRVAPDKGDDLDGFFRAKQQAWVCARYFALDPTS